MSPKHVRHMINIFMAFSLFITSAKLQWDLFLCSNQSHQIKIFI